MYIVHIRPYGPGAGYSFGSCQRSLEWAEFWETGGRGLNGTSNVKEIRVYFYFKYIVNYNTYHKIRHSKRTDIIVNALTDLCRSWLYPPSQGQCIRLLLSHSPKKAIFWESLSHNLQSYIIEIAKVISSYNMGGKIGTTQTKHYLNNVDQSHKNPHLDAICWPPR